MISDHLFAVGILFSLVVVCNGDWKYQLRIRRSKRAYENPRDAGLKPRRKVGPTKPGAAPGAEVDRMAKRSEESFQKRLKEETPNFGKKRVVPRPKGMSANRPDPYAGDTAMTKIENTIVGRARWPKTRYRKDKPPRTR